MGSPPRRLLILLLVLALLVGVAARADAIWVPSLGGSDDTKIDGLVAGGGALEVRMEDGHVVSIDTDLTAVCRGGYGWTAHWSPSQGSTGDFRQSGSRFTVRETQEQDDPGGRWRRVTVLLRGRLSPDRRSAGGFVWLSARFYRGSGETQACESGPLGWAVGEHGRELAGTPRPHSAERMRFIARVDATCARTYNAGMRRSRELARRLGTSRRALLRISADYIDWHGGQVRAVERLGDPPEAEGLYRAWLGNMRLRVALEARQLAVYRRGHVRQATRLERRIARLKTAGNETGQRFGLQVCTSNGPDRSPAVR